MESLLKAQRARRAKEAAAGFFCFPYFFFFFARRAKEATAGLFFFYFLFYVSFSFTKNCGGHAS
jgi:hypothetical protein